MAKFKKVSADEAISKRVDHTKEVGGGHVLMKAFNSPKSYNKDERSARFIMSSESVDRYQDVVIQEGLDITRFLQNPQALVFHNSRSWPVGKWEDIEKKLSGRPRRTEGKLVLLPEGVEPDADRAAGHLEHGTLRTVSIGFLIDWDEVDYILDDDEEWTGGFRFNKSELIECSLVPIPAQPDALVRNAGGEAKLALEIVENILETYAKDPASGLIVPRSAYEKQYRIIKAKAFEDLIVKPKEKDAPKQEVADEADEAEFQKAKAALKSGAEITRVTGGAGEKPGVTITQADESVAVFHFDVTEERANELADHLKTLNDDDSLGIAEIEREIGKLVVAKGEGRVVMVTGAKSARLIEQADKWVYTGPADDGVCNHAIIAVEAEDKTVKLTLVDESGAESVPAAAGEPTSPKEDPKINTQAVGALTIKVDTKEVEEKVGIIGKMIDGLAEKFAGIFTAKHEIRTEPTIVPPKQPSADEVAAAKAKSQKIRERLAAKL